MLHVEMSQQQQQSQNSAVSELLTSSQVCYLLENGVDGGTSGFLDLDFFWTPEEGNDPHSTGSGIDVTQLEQTFNRGK
jgi:hypothetical protein